MCVERRRGKVLEDAILDAATAELLGCGYPGFAMDRVAARAGTNKNAIYRRWPSRPALAAAAYRRLAHTRLRPPGTGRLREDVLALLRRMNADLDSPHGDLLRGLVAGLAEEPELLEQLRAEATEGAREPWRTVIDQARGRGEIGPAAIHPRVATVAVTLLRNEYLTRGIRPVTDDVLVEIVDEVYVPLLRARSNADPGRSSAVRWSEPAVRLQDGT